MTRSAEEVERAIELRNQGLNISQIARAIGVSRAAVRDWLAGRIPKRVHSPSSDPLSLCPICCDTVELLPVRQYAYLLGQYLGDGMLTHCRRDVWKLRIFTASAYPGIVEECARAMEAVRPINKVGFVRYSHTAMVEVNSHWKHWICLFPQAGPGLKHKRPIVLVRWQLAIICECPEQFLRGLIHSDGCRCMNRVKVRGKKYEYPRYMFSNRSVDIQELFGFACDLLNIEWRNNNWHSISVAKRDSVAKMDEFIGPKA